MRSAEELKVYAIGGRRVVFVPREPRGGAAGYLDSRGILSEWGDPRGWGLTRVVRPTSF